MLLSTPCIEWTGSRNNNGYGWRWLDGRLQLVTRLLWAEKHGPIPPGVCILHKCDNRGCYREDHLYAGTKKDNARDRSVRKRYRDDRGELHPSAKLTAKQVLQIRARLARGEGLTRISHDFPVTPQMIYRIKRRTAWRHI